MSEAALRSTPGLRTAVVCLVLAFAALFVLNVLVSSSASVEQAEQYFQRAEIERGLQYSHERKLLTWCGVGLHLALLTSLVCTSWSRRLTDWFDRLTGRRWLLTLLLVGGTYFLLNELLSLPLGLAGLKIAQNWHMTEQSVGAWLIDHAKGLGVAAVQSAIVVLGLYGLMRVFPRYWWLLAQAVGTVLLIVYIWLMPIVILPLFNQFTPLDDPYLQQRVLVLADKAQVPVDEVLVMDASSRGRHTNAYFVGFGSTRRVVLYDTLLKSHSGVQPESVASTVGLLANGPGGGPWLAASQAVAARKEGTDEIESVLAHEMGHWRHHHIVKGIALVSVAGVLGWWLLSRILLWAVHRRPFCLNSPSDPAGLPLILLLMMLGNWLTMPVQNAISRAFERQADQTSLEVAGQPGAFIAAEERLARDNLSNVAPTPFNVWMFSTHPPPVERIRMAEEWQKRGQ
jgi:STE24 endopeptidase